MKIHAGTVWLYIMPITRTEPAIPDGWTIARILVYLVACLGASFWAGSAIGRRLHLYTPPEEGGDDA